MRIPIHSTAKLTLTDFPHGFACRVNTENPAGFDPDASIILNPNLPDTGDYLAINNHSPFWCSPFWGEHLSDLPEHTQELLIRQADGSYLCLLPVCDSVFKTEIRGHQGATFDFVMSTNCTGVTECRDQLAFVCMEGENPLSLLRACAKAAAEQLGNGLRMRSEKPFPAVFESLGWCSWDAFQIRVSHAGLLDKAREFRKKDVPVRFAILDDMWADVPKLRTVPPDADFGKMVDVMHHSPMRRFAGDPIRFPNGMDAAIADLKAEGIRDVGIWFPTTGYWAGFDPNGEEFSRYRDSLIFTKTSVFCPDDAIAVIAPEREKAGAMFDDFCARVKAWGGDFVKIDNQGFHSHYRNFAPIGESARAIHGAIDVAAEKHFGGALINCMGMPSECLFNRKSAVCRCSDDFMPESREWFTKNILQCAYNGLLQGQYYYNDWDMWWTDDGQAEKNSVCRAISGGPIYVSDKLGRTDPDILRPLCYRDGTILRPDESATPTADCLMQNSTTAGMPFKIRNRMGDCGVVAAFNIDAENRTVRGTVSPTDAGLPAGDYGYYEHFTGAWGLLRAGESLPVTLANNDAYRLWRFVPYNEGSVTVLGRLDLFMGVGAVKHLDRDSVTFREGGQVGFLVDRKDGRKPYFYSVTMPQKEDIQILFSSIVK